MRRFRQTFLVCGLSALMSSCGSTLTLQSNKDFMQVKRGMTQTEVREILGKPSYQRFNEDMEQWEYQKTHAISGQETTIIVDFIDGHVSSMDSFDTPTQPVPPVETIVIEKPQHPNRHLRPMNEKDFGNLYETIKRKSFDDERMELLSVGIVKSYFSCDQCADLVSLFTWDDNKMKAIDLMANRLVDPGNGEVIVKQLSSMFKQDDARKRLGLIKR
ncbi:MAG: DUF4476 domain-containing protein [Bacteroidales bacterium]|nr:DUF4476 domain-containing protein [Bacteroidales bacterium]